MADRHRWGPHPVPAEVPHDSFELALPSSSQPSAVALEAGLRAVALVARPLCVRGNHHTRGRRTGSGARTLRSNNPTDAIVDVQPRHARPRDVLLSAPRNRMGDASRAQRWREGLMSALINAVRAGFYARKQIDSRSRLIAWSHRGRFATSLRLAREITAVRVLDYGCGDGTFLGLLMNGEPAPRLAVGAELTVSIVADCRERFKAQKGLHFMLIDDLERPAHHSAYDAVYCMEVLEHVVDPAAMLDTFDQLLAPGGTLIISVPI